MILICSGCEFFKEIFLFWKMISELFSAQLPDLPRVWSENQDMWAELIIWEPDHVLSGVGTRSWWPDVITIQSLPAAGADVCWNAGLWLVQSSHNGLWLVHGSGSDLRVCWEYDGWTGNKSDYDLGHCGDHRLWWPEVGVGRHYVNTNHEKEGEETCRNLSSWLNITHSG